MTFIVDLCSVCFPGAISAGNILHFTTNFFSGSTSSRLVVEITLVIQILSGITWTVAYSE